MATKRGVAYVKVVMEFDEDEFDKGKSYTLGRIQGAVRDSRFGVIAIGVYDEDDVMVGLSVTGTPTEETQDMLDTIFFDREEVNGAR